MQSVIIEYHLGRTQSLVQTAKLNSLPYKNESEIRNQRILILNLRPSQHQIPYNRLDQAKAVPWSCYIHNYGKYQTTHN